jgi:hypothetical protein
MLATRDAVIESTSGRPSAGPAALQHQDGLVGELVAGRVGLIQLVQDGLDLSGKQDLPLHTAPSRRAAQRGNLV